MTDATRKVLASSCPVCGHESSAAPPFSCSECGASIEWRPYSPDAFLNGIPSAWALTVFSTLLGLVSLQAQLRTDVAKINMASVNALLSETRQGISRIKFDMVVARRYQFDEPTTLSALQTSMDTSERLARTPVPPPIATIDVITSTSSIDYIPLLALFTICPLILAVSLVGRYDTVHSRRSSRLVAICICLYCAFSFAYASSVLII